MADSRIENFKKIKKLIAEYVPPLKVLTDLDSRYETYFDKTYETQSLRTGNKMKKDKLYFATLIIQKDYLGFYFMPIYSHPNIFKGVSGDVKKILKGKSCLHIKRLDEKIMSELKVLLDAGFKIYNSLPQNYTF